MNLVIAALTYLYSRLLLLYPVKFRDEFAGEMQIVFRDSVSETSRDGILPLAILCLRELGGLPFNVLREFWHEFERKETMMLHENSLNTLEKPASTGQVVIGSLPFLMFGLLLIFFALPHEWNIPAWVQIVGGFLFVLLLILPAIGFGVGWAQSFPRWSYPYAGMAFIMALYVANVTTPGLNILGYPIFGRDPWGWRAWIPLGVASVVALVVSRSFKPFVKLFSNLWKDWSILSYLMAGFLPLGVAIAFDEMDRLYSLYFMMPFAVLLVGMAVFYLLGQYTWQRVLALTVGILAILVATALGTNSYWSEHGDTSLEGVWRTLGMARTIALIMLVPAWLELLRRSMGRLRTT